MTDYKQEWDLKNGLFTAGVEIITYMSELVRKYYPEYSDLFPFKIGYSSDFYREGNFYCLQIKEKAVQLPACGNLKDQTIITLAKTVFSYNHFPNHFESYKILNKNGFSYDTFTYIGEINGSKLSWGHIIENLIMWLNHLVIPKVMEMNLKRVKDAIPTPPNYDISRILNNIYVIESEKGMLQGTAFHLKGIGLITCDHVVRDEHNNKLLTDVKLFRGTNFKNKVPVTIEYHNSTIDLAILSVKKNILSEGLDKGETDNLKQMEHIAVAGFPNYNFGDSGIFSPGLIVGFRTYSGIRYILINTPLISGISGGPALDKNNKVIGIAITGAEKMSKANETEKHGLIPIDVLNLIK